MPKVTIVIKGDKDVQLKLKRLGRSLHDFKHSMDRIGSKASDYFANQGFGSQGGVFNSKWSRLSPGYAAQKSKRYPGRPPLVATGAMQNSFEHKARPESVTVTNSSPYFKYHQSSLPRTKMPRRQTMGVNEPVRRIVRQELQAEMRRKIARA